MKKLLIALLILPGWLLAIMYLLHVYMGYGNESLSYLLSSESPGRIIFHAFVLFAPVASTALGVFTADRMRLLDRLRDLSGRYEDYYQHAPYGYHSIGPDMTLLEVNDTWLDMLGYGRDEVVGRMRMWEFLPRDDRESSRAILQGLIQDGKIENKELVFLRKDGERLPVLISSTAVYDDRGGFLRSRTIVKDNTQRKHMDEALTMVARRWSETFDTMPWGVMVLDRDLHVLRSNRYFDKHPELSPRELAATRCKVALAKAKMRSLGADSNGTHVEEYMDEALDRHFRMYLSPMGGDGDSVVSVVDVTDLRKGEKKLMDSRNAFFNMLKDASMAYGELEEVHTGLIHALANAIDAKSPWTKGHSERVTRYSIALGEAIELPHRDLDKLRTAALLHDIGKIGTYDFLLDKTTSLTDDEYTEIKLHPGRAAEILGPINRFGEIIEIVRHHHEHFDGGGYPAGLKGDEIPLMARILCVADSYDSMTADRPYRSARSRQFAEEELAACSGTHFAPQLVEVFIKLLREEKV